MKKFKYKLEQVKNGGLIVQLDEEGKNGWELIIFLPSTLYKIGTKKQLLLFKREVK